MTACGSRWRARAPGRPWRLEHLCAALALEESGGPFPWSSFRAREGGQVWREHITHTLGRAELPAGRGRSRLGAAWTRYATSGPLALESASIEALDSGTEKRPRQLCGSSYRPVSSTRPPAPQKCAISETIAGSFGRRGRAGMI